MELTEIVEPIITWYQENHRVLPWRENQNPYSIWISEIMLQQTRVEAVKFYYTRFMKRIPDIKTLSEISEEELMKLWEGLGYYSRARNLKKAAKQIMEQYHGEMPHTYQELLKLAGIGEYTAGAIASIAFKELVPAIDGNVFRVIMRVQNDDRNISKLSTKKELFKSLSLILPKEVDIFNQALMELGALICVPNGLPLCLKCPLSFCCKAYHMKTILELPQKEPKKERKILNKTVLLLIHYNEVAIQKRDGKGLLAGLYEFPNFDGHLEEKKVLSLVREKGLLPVRILELPKAKHLFTHLEWHMIGYLVFVDTRNDFYIWENYQYLKELYALPTAFSVYEKALKELIERK